MFSTSEVYWRLRAQGSYPGLAWVLTKGKQVFTRNRLVCTHIYSRTASYLIHPGNVETRKPNAVRPILHQLDSQRVPARLVKWTVAQSPITTPKGTWAATLNTGIRMGLTGKVTFRQSFGDKKKVRWKKRRRRREIPCRDCQCKYSEGRGCCVWKRVRRLVQCDSGKQEGRVRENLREVRGHDYFCSLCSHALWRTFSKFSSLQLSWALNICKFFFIFADRVLFCITDWPWTCLYPLSTGILSVTSKLGWPPALNHDSLM